MNGAVMPESNRKPTLEYATPTRKTLLWTRKISAVLVWELASTASVAMGAFSLLLLLGDAWKSATYFSSSGATIALWCLRKYKTANRPWMISVAIFGSIIFAYALCDRFRIL
jgi:hypothetical protein